MSKLSFVLLAVYLIAVTALLADFYLLAADCPVSIRIVDTPIAAGYCDE